MKNGKNANILTVSCSWSVLLYNFEEMLQTVNLSAFSAGFRRGPKEPGPRGPTMVMCLAICATCTCHLVIFSEKILFVDAIDYN